MALTLSLSSITPLQKKLISGALIGGAGFWGGIKFCDVKIKAQIGQYEVKIEKLNKTVEARDTTISEYFSEKEEKMKEALIAKKEADDAHKTASEAEARYRKLIAQSQSMPDRSVAIEGSPASLPAKSVTVADVSKACDEVIEAKNVEIKGLNAAYSNVFDAKAAADLAIKGLQSNEASLKKEVSLNEKINSDLSKQVESQKRRKWLYFAGGIILGVAADKAIRK
jgi:chromosome segregation ATPase